MFLIQYSEMWFVFYAYFYIIKSIWLVYIWSRTVLMFRLYKSTHAFPQPVY